MDYIFFFFLKKRVIRFYQNSWLKYYIDTNTDPRKKAKHDFEKCFYKLLYIAVFAITTEKVRKHRDIKLAITKRGRNYLVSEQNYYIFHRKSISNKK